MVDTLADHPGVRLVGTTHAELASPPVGEPNPVRDRVVTSPWPYDPLGARRDRMEAAAAAVRAVGPVRRDDLVGEPLAAASQGVGREILRLLAERDLAAGDGRRGVVVLPAHLSASRAVQLAADPDGLALALRRPMPSEPRPSTRRGTAFHAWMEQRLRSDALIDLDDLPGAGDDHAAADDELPRLQAAFEASEWASREVVAVEVDVETPVAGMVLRGRIDAVFAGTPLVRDALSRNGFRAEIPQGCRRQPELLGEGYDVVDWKTGVPPTGDAAARRSGTARGVPVGVVAPDARCRSSRSAPPSSTSPQVRRCAPQAISTSRRWSTWSPVSRSTPMTRPLEEGRAHQR